MQGASSSKKTVGQSPAQIQKKLTDFQDELTQIEEDEAEGNRNVFANMQKLCQTNYFSNSKPLKRQAIPEFEPRSNDLNSRAFNGNAIIKSPNGTTEFKNLPTQSKPFGGMHCRSKTTGIDSEMKFPNPSQQNCQTAKISQYSLKLPPHQHGGYGHRQGSMAEENINDNDLGISEFDECENASAVPHNINASSLFNSQNYGFFNSKMDDLKERKGRCHTLLPKKAQKYFKDQKSTKSYVGVDPSIAADTLTFKSKKIQSISEDFQEECSIQPIMSNDQSYDFQEDHYSNKRTNRKLMNEPKIQSQSQIAQPLPESVFDTSKFNHNFNSQSSIGKSSKNISKQWIFSQPTSSRQEASTPLFAAPSTKSSTLQLSVEEIKSSPQTEQLLRDQALFSPKIHHSPNVIYETDQIYERTQNTPTICSPAQPFGAKPEIPSQQLPKDAQSSVRQSISVDLETCNIQQSRYTLFPGLNSQIDLQEGISRMSQMINHQQDYHSLKLLPHENTSQKVPYYDNQSLKIYLNDNTSIKIPPNDNASSKVMMQNDNQSQIKGTSDCYSMKIPIENQMLRSNDIHPQRVQSLSSSLGNGLLQDQQSSKFQKRPKKSLQQLINDHESHQENDTVIGNMVGTVNTIDIRIDTQTLRTAKFIDKKEQNRKIDEEIYTSLIQAIFQNNALLVQTLLQRVIQEERYHLVNQVDEQGNTPLLLAAKLSHYNSSYYSIVKMLLKSDSNPRIRDRKDWSCFEEVVSQNNVKLASLILDYLISYKQKSLLTQKREIDNMLSEVPDFYMEMKWEFESTIIPFVSKLAPSDTFKIWKYGRSVRCDSTYAGLQKYKAKRRAQSLIYNCVNLKEKNISQSINNMFLVIIHKEEKTYHFPLVIRIIIEAQNNEFSQQDLDEEEKKKIIQDLLGSSESLQGNLKIEQSSIKQSKSFFGTLATQKVSGFQCDKYDLKLKYRYQIFKKTRVPFMVSYEKYINPNIELSPSKSQLSQYEILSLSKQKEESALSQSQNNISLKEIRIGSPDGSNPFEIQISEAGKNEVKKQTLGLYVSKEFPMKFKAFMPLLQFLSNGNQMLTNLIEVFKDSKVSEILKHGFPVKVQVPLSYSIYANITFSSYQQD